MDTDPEKHNVSDPLKHLLAMDFGRTSPLLDDIAQNVDNALLGPVVKRKIKSVRFADQYAPTPLGSMTESANASKKNKGVPNQKVKGILKTNDTLKVDNFTLSSILSEDSSFSKNVSDQNSSVLISMDIQTHNKIISKTSSTNSDDAELDEEYYNEEQYKEKNIPVREYLIHHNNLTGNETEHLGVDNIGIASNKSERVSGDHERESINYRFDNKKNSMSSNRFVSLEENTSNTEQHSLLKEIAQISKVLVKEQIKLIDSDHISHEEQNNLLITKNIYSNKTISSTNMCKSQSLSKKPKPHFCVASLTNQDRYISHKLSDAVELSALQMSLSSGSGEFSSNFNYPTSKQSMKLKSILKAEDSEPLTAKELKSTVFRAWRKVKNQEKGHIRETETSNEFIEGQKSDIKAAKLDASAKAYIFWKQRKEHSSKIKTEKALKTSVLKTSLEEDRKNKDDERNLAYNAWKRKKDEQLKEKLWNERRKATTNKINLLETEELKKKDAASAFLAWKTQKQKDHNNKKNPHNSASEIEELKVAEKAERDTEAQEAYYLWLQYKENSQDIHSWRFHVEHKPPWNPPG